MSLPLLWVVWQHIMHLCVRCLPVQGGMCPYHTWNILHKRGIKKITRGTSLFLHNTLKFYKTKTALHLYKTKTVLHLYKTMTVLHLYKTKTALHLYKTKTILHLYKTKTVLHLYKTKTVLHLYKTKTVLHLYKTKTALHLYKTKTAVHLPQNWGEETLKCNTCYISLWVSHTHHSDFITSCTRHTVRAASDDFLLGCLVGTRLLAFHN